MSKTSDRKPPRYDFSPGVRGKYSERLGGPEAPWVQDMVRRDAERWLAELLMRLQRLEGALVAYFSVVQQKPLAAAGQAASDVLEDPKSRSSDVLWADVRSHSEFAGDLRATLLSLLTERNWFIHKSSFALSMRSQAGASDPLLRIERAVAKAEAAERALQDFFFKRCHHLGYSRHDAEEKAQRAIEQWAAA